MVIEQCQTAEYNHKIEKIYEIKELELKKQKEEDEESKRQPEAPLEMELPSFDELLECDIMLGNFATSQFESDEVAE